MQFLLKILTITNIHVLLNIRSLQMAICTLVPKCIPVIPLRRTIGTGPQESVHSPELTMPLILPPVYAMIHGSKCLQFYRTHPSWGTLKMFPKIRRLKTLSLSKKIIIQGDAAFQSERSSKNPHPS